MRFQWHAYGSSTSPMNRPNDDHSDMAITVQEVRRRSYYQHRHLNTRSKLGWLEREIAAGTMRRSTRRRRQDGCGPSRLHLTRRTTPTARSKNGPPVLKRLRIQPFPLVLPTSALPPWRSSCALLQHALPDTHRPSESDLDRGKLLFPYKGLAGVDCTRIAVARANRLGRFRHGCMGVVHLNVGWMPPC